MPDPEPLYLGHFPVLGLQSATFRVKEQMSFSETEWACLLLALKQPVPQVQDSSPEHNFQWVQSPTWAYLYHPLETGELM